MSAGRWALGLGLWLVVVGCKRTEPEDDSPKWLGLDTNGYEICGVRADHSVVCAERDADLYQTGIQDVPEGLEAVSVDLTQNHACAVTTDQGIRCWGDRGAPDVGAYSNEVVVSQPVDAGYCAVETYASEACALRCDGELVCWGKHDGEFGDVGLVRLAPSEGTWTRLSLGTVGCATDESEELTCWGGDGASAAGDDLHLISGRPTWPVAAFDVADSGCALSIDRREATCWGNEVDRPPVPPEEPGSWASYPSVKSFTGWSCGLDLVGELRCTGTRSGFDDDPGDLPPISGPWAPFVGSYQGYCGADRDGQVWCFGDGRGVERIDL